MEYNKKFENELETAALEFLENKDNYKEIVSVFHTDADGLASAAIIKQMCKKLKLPLKEYPNNLSLSWTSYIETELKEIKESSAVLFSDCSPPINDLISLARKYPKTHFYNLDHHLMKPYNPEDIPENLYLVNPTIFGLNGLKQIAGATLNYLFASTVEDSIEKIAWMAAIGIAGDALQFYSEYRSYNKDVIEIALEREDLELLEGIRASGARFETLDKALAYSIFPFVPRFMGDPEKAAQILKELDINPKIKVEELTAPQWIQLGTEIDSRLIGEYIVFSKKSGLLRYPFEHAELVSHLGDKKPLSALSLIYKKRIPLELKTEYQEYIKYLVSSLVKLVTLDNIETDHVIIFDLTGKVESSFWSKIASYASINELYPNKILFIGGLDEKTKEYRFSVRENEKLLKKNENKFAVNKIITKICEKYKETRCRGGGHAIAGGLRIQLDALKPFAEDIEMFLN